MRIIRCFFCEKPTVLQIKSIQKWIGGKKITLAEAPVYFCKECNETFHSKEVQDAFQYIKSNGLQNKSILFRFDDIWKRCNAKRELREKAE
jgi:YgiT-type zinc finger domain-containing protein